VTLFPYQAEGAAFLAKRRKALLADGMGLGKSAQAIVAAQAIEAKKVVVICPAIAVPMWVREFPKWALNNEITPYVVSYDRVRLRQDIRLAIEKMRPDVLILDEAHYLKERTSKRTKAIYGQFCRGDGLVAHAKCVWLLTGTPAPNDVSELFPHIRALWPDMLPAPGNYDAFLKQYCVTVATPYGLKVVGNKNMTDLRKALSMFMLRRKAEDVLKDLPPIVWEDTVLEPIEAAKELEQLENSEEFAVLRDLLKESGEETELPDTVAMATLRRLTGMAKAPAIASMLAEELKGQQYNKVIVFAHHRDVIEKLHQELREFGCVVITGSTTQSGRAAAIDRFQDDPNCRVFIGQIQACATAITLHAAHHVVFAEASWTPSDNVQAAKRAHRIGQNRPVIVRMIGLAGSIDEAVTAVLARKSRLISEVLEQENRV
jgi:SWI/SNF-related matrix-associated actin-dependent regulator of chromatin subfamily A-like protein 1